MTTKNLQDTLNAMIVGHAVLEAIEAAGDDGAPSGVLYAGLMTGQVSVNYYQQMMGSLQRKEMVTNEGDVYFLTERGKAFSKTLAAKLAPLESPKASTMRPRMR